MNTAAVVMATFGGPAHQRCHSPRAISVHSGRMKRIGRMVRLGLVNGVRSVYWLPKTWRRLLYRVCGFEVGSATIFPGRLSGPSGCRSAVARSSPLVLVRPRRHPDRRLGLSELRGLASGDHEIGPSTKRAGREVARPIVIEDGAWIGTKRRGGARRGDNSAGPHHRSWRGGDQEH
jgi:hypothetical protein